MIIGSGPIARLLATSITSDARVALGVRESTGMFDVRTAQASRLRGRRSPRVRRVELWPVSDVDADNWDIVISTAPVIESDVSDLFRAAGPDVVLASVSQVPSEIEALRDIAGEHRWAVITPNVLAWTSGMMTHWWQPGAARFTIAEPVGGEIAQTLFGGERWAASGSVSSGLLAAAAVMPMMAALQVSEFEQRICRSTLRSGAAAADEAGRAVAAAYGVHEPRSVNPVIVGIGLRAMRACAPFDVDDYFRAHFGSHTHQTTTMLDDWIVLGNTYGLRTEALVTLRDALSDAAGAPARRANPTKP